MREVTESLTMPRRSVQFGRTWFGLTSLLVIASLAAGCSSRPQPPSLVVSFDDSLHSFYWCAHLIHSPARFDTAGGTLTVNGIRYVEPPLRVLPDSSYARLYHDVPFVIRLHREGVPFPEAALRYTRGVLAELDSLCDLYDRMARTDSSAALAEAQSRVDTTFLEDPPGFQVVNGIALVRNRRFGTMRRPVRFRRDHPYPQHVPHSYLGTISMMRSMLSEPGESVIFADPASIVGDGASADTVRIQMAEAQRDPAGYWALKDASIRGMLRDGRAAHRSYVIPEQVIGELIVAMKSQPHSDSAR